MIPTELQRHPRPQVVRVRPDELAAWRSARRRERRRAERALRAMFALLFLLGAAGGYAVAVTW
jgi:hypothetical protein